MKIGLTGTISCGKTTLAKSLGKLPEFKNYQIITERSEYLRDLGVPLNTDSTLIGQNLFLAERSRELWEKNIITDRTLIDIMSFTKASKSINYYEKQDFCQYVSHLLKEYDYIFYVSPEGVEIENNGVRETDPIYRDLIDFTIKNTLDQYRYKIKNLIYIKGTNDERISQILEAIDI